MLAVSLLVATFVLMRRNKKRFLFKALFIFAILTGVYWFIQSDSFYSLFIKNNIWDMLAARLVYWKMGIDIMIDSPSNFIIGIGLNNIVDFIDLNYSKYAGLVSTASSILNSEFVRGMPIHNSFLIVGCELGILGIVLYIRIYMRIVLDSIKMLGNKRVHHDEKWVYVFLLAATVVIMVYCMQGWATHKDFAWTMIVVLAVTNKKTQIMNPKQIAEE